MGYKIIISILLMLSVSIAAYGSGGSKMKKWWKDDYQQQQQEIQREAQATISDPERQQCVEDLQRWESRLVTEPNSLYYQYKREQTTRRCMQYIGLE